MKQTVEIMNRAGSGYPPIVPGRPVVGNVPDLLSYPARFFLKCYRQYGPIFRIRMFNRVIPVLAGPEAHQFMSTERGEYLRSREFWQGLVEEFGAKKALISTDGEIHSRLRAVMKRGFSRSSIRNRYDRIIDITDSMIAKDWQPGREVGVVEAMQRMATEQLGIMVAGKAPGEYVDPMRIFIRDLLNTRVTRTRPAILLYRPAFQNARRKIFQMGQEILDRYDPSAADPVSPTLMDDIMQAAAEDPDLFPGPELMLAALSPYIAGLDTVANTMSAMLYAVLKHREVYEAVRSEVDHHFASGLLTEASLRSMPALHGLVMETLRLYPIAILAMRYTNKAFSFAGCQVDADSPVYMATTVTHLMPEFFPEPEKFDITRYAPPRSEHRRPGAFAPFGLGPHTCLGAGMAEVQMMLTMATLLNRLDLELVPPDYTLKTIVNPAPGPEYGFKVRVVGRRSTKNN